MNSKEKVFKVIEITRLVKRSLEREFNDLWIEGEISNLKRPKSGHIYLTIKDEYSQIQAVKFKPNNFPVYRDLKDGDKVRVYGNISVYERSGQYQPYVRNMEKLGIGDLQVRFNKLKEKLQEEGLFDKKFKKSLPSLPGKIGIVTSPTGAAVRDMLNVLERRFSNVHVIVYPVKVQGPGAAEEIASALDSLNAMKEVDVIIVGRGGGSIEDLWAFNEEIVARAVFRSNIPVISAVGHEIDYTISDFTADLRAETPTAAAELVLKKKDDFVNEILWLREKLIKSISFTLRDYQARLRRCMDHHALKSPRNMILQFAQHIDEMEWRLKNIMARVFNDNKSFMIKEKEKLQALNPMNILRRGYSITQDFHSKKIIKDVKSLKTKSKLRTILHKGEIISVVEQMSAAEGAGHEI